MAADWEIEDVDFCLEDLTSITQSIYLFVQQMITIKWLDLDPDEYERNSHRYRTRVEANAAALDLLCLSCNDTTGTSRCFEQLCSIDSLSQNISTCSSSFLIDLTKQSKGSLSTYALLFLCSCRIRGSLAFVLSLSSKQENWRERLLFTVFNCSIRFSDCLEAEKLCAKCAEKFSEETITTKLIFAQTPLLVTSLEVSRRDLFF